jgi:hypothetical protein
MRQVSRTSQQIEAIRMWLLYDVEWFLLPAKRRPTVLSSCAARAGTATPRRTAHVTIA